MTRLVTLLLEGIRLIWCGLFLTKLLSFCHLFFSCCLSSCYFLDALLIFSAFFQELELGWVTYNSLITFVFFFFLKKDTFYPFPMLWQFIALFLIFACFHLEAHGLCSFAWSGKTLGSSEGLRGACNWGGGLGKPVSGGRCVWGWPPHTYFFPPLPQTTAWVGITNKCKDKNVSV